MNRRLDVIVLSILGSVWLSGASPDRGSTADRPTPRGDAAFEAELTLSRAFFEERQTGLESHERAAVARTTVLAARRSGLPLELVLAVIEVESSGDNFALSRVGAMGLMQLLPETAEAEAARIGIAWRGPTTLLDPCLNVRLGVSYLAALIARFDDVPTALVAYNTSPTRVARLMRGGRVTPAAYSSRVLTRWQRGDADIGRS